MSSASSIARRMDETVDSMLTTTPLRSPLLGCVPIPMMSIPPSSVSSATIAQILVVPMSSPTMISPPFCLAMVSLQSPPFSGWVLLRRFVGAAPFGVGCQNLDGHPVRADPVVQVDDLSDEVAGGKLPADAHEALEGGLHVPFRQAHLLA